MKGPGWTADATDPSLLDEPRFLRGKVTASEVNKDMQRTMHRYRDPPSSCGHEGCPVCEKDPVDETAEQWVERCRNGPHFLHEPGCWCSVCLNKTVPSLPAEAVQSRTDSVQKSCTSTDDRVIKYYKAPDNCGCHGRTCGLVCECPCHQVAWLGRYPHASLPKPTIRARKVTDVRSHHVAEFFPGMDHGDVVAVTVDKNVDEGYIEVVYRIPVESDAQEEKA